MLATVKFDNGDSIQTPINGNEKEVRQYYAIGRTFNLGYNGEDKEAKVVEVQVQS